jgi:hypothetical protein
MTLESAMTTPRLPRSFSLLAALLAVTTAGAGLAQSGAEDVAIAAPEPQRILLVAPHDGATVPTNARVAFSMNFGGASGIEGEMRDGDDIEVLSSTEVACPNVCVGLFEPSALLPGTSPELTLGTNIELSTGVSYTVSEAEDNTPPTLDAPPALTSTWEAFNGEHLGYNLELLVARAEDNFGIAYYEIRTGSSDTEELPVTAMLMGPEENLEAFAFLSADATQACAEVIAVDYAGHKTTTERVCEDTVPPTEDELAETIVQGGCFGSPEPVDAPRMALVGLFLLRRVRRRR